MSKIIANELQSLATGNKASADHLAAASVKVLVNFNGTGAVAVRSSVNLASITDHGTGDYTVNITAAMANANYCGISGIGGDGGWGQIYRSSGNNSSYIGKTTTTHRFNVSNNAANANVDTFDVPVGIAGLSA